MWIRACLRPRSWQRRTRTSKCSSPRQPVECPVVVCPQGIENSRNQFYESNRCHRRYRPSRNSPSSRLRRHIFGGSPVSGFGTRVRWLTLPGFVLVWGLYMWISNDIEGVKDVNIPRVFIPRIFLKSSGLDGKVVIVPVDRGFRTWIRGSVGGCHWRCLQGPPSFPIVLTDCWIPPINDSRSRSSGFSRDTSIMYSDSVMSWSSQTVVGYCLGCLLWIDEATSYDVCRLLGSRLSTYWAIEVYYESMKRKLKIKPI
jgi:hypothetical protein